MERQSRKPVHPSSSCRQRSHSCEGILDSGDIYIADAGEFENSKFRDLLLLWMLHHGTSLSNVFRTTSLGIH